MLTEREALKIKIQLLSYGISFDMDLFENEGFGIEEVEDEYNPTFLINFKYKDDHEYIEEKLALAIELIEEAMEKAFNNIEGKEEEYQ